MATIGSLNVLLGMNTAQFSSGAKSAKSTLASMVPGVSSAAGMFSGLGGAIAGVGAVLGAGAIAMGFKSMVSSQMEAIDATAKVSDRLGITTESLIGLRHAANLSGVGVEDFDASLEKMTKNLGNAAAEGGPTADALKQIGLDAKALASQAPDEAFKQIAEGISQVENPAQRARAATDIFGKSGQQLLNTLMAGRAGIEAQAAETEKLGTAVSRVDSAKVEAANDAMTRAGEVVTGLATQVAVQLAPFIEVAANKFIELATSGTNMGTLVSSAFEVVAKSVAFVADMWDVLILGFKGAQYLIVKGLALQSELWLGIGKAVAWIARQLGADVEISFLEQINQSLHASADEIGKDFMERLIAPSSGEKVTAFFDEVRSSAQQAAEAVAKTAQEQSSFGESVEQSSDSVAKLIEKFQVQAKFFGIEGRRLEIAKLSLQAGDEQLAQLDELDHKLKQLEENNESKARFKELEDSALNAAQKFEREMGAIQEAFVLGQLTPEEFELEKLAAERDFAPQDSGPQRPAALERGTAAAFSASFGPKQDKLAQLNEQIRDILRDIRAQNTTQTI